MRGSLPDGHADGDRFDAEIAPFRLTQANLLN
jgi:hypothetical protein